ncbi:MAG: demethoxyubiquinone hydroxylase family protein [Clostridia bacterium]|nr:demethoxyubiquinone hydroxylase family protein [Clostridia bacterium]
MNSKMKSICEYDAPYPEIRVERKNPNYARMLSLAYAGPDSELTTILSYLYGNKVCTGKMPASLSDMLKYIAKVEMRHLDMLGELIMLLGGDPRFASGPRCHVGINTAMLNYQTDTAMVLRNAIAGEEGAVRLYNELIRAIDDRYIREILKRIIKDEEHHIKLFREMAGTSMYNGR